MQLNIKLQITGMQEVTIITTIIEAINPGLSAD
jgi:hypothetical protein